MFRFMLWLVFGLPGYIRNSYPSMTLRKFIGKKCLSQVSMKQCVDCVVTLLFQNPPNTFSGGVLGGPNTYSQCICKTRVRSWPPPSCSWGTKQTHVTQALEKIPSGRSLKEKSNGGPAQTARPWPRMRYVMTSVKIYRFGGCFLKWWVFPPNHPFEEGISIINHPFWGTPLFLETPWWLNQPIWKILPSRELTYPTWKIGKSSTQTYL